MFNKLVNKTTEIMTKHPRLFSLAVGFAITLAVGTAIGMVVDPSHHLAFAGNANSGSNTALWP